MVKTPESGSGSRRSVGGFTLVELTVTTGIAAVLLGMVIGLSRHLNAVTNIKQAQVDLAEWQQALHEWYLEFGEYPYAAIDSEGNIEPLVSETGKQMRYNLSNVLDRAAVWLKDLPGGSTNITFKSFMKGAGRITDPWRQQYVYLCDENHRSYTLFSTGPNAKSEVLGDQAHTSLDDIYAER